MSMIYLLPPLEMVFFNSITMHRCSHKKYANSITVAVLSLFTAVFLGIGYYLRFPLTGDSKYGLTGLLYLIPLKFLYREKLSRLFVSMCMSWVYTLGVASVAVQITGLLDSSRSIGFQIIVETILFLITMVPFYREVVPKYIFVLQNIELFGENEYKYLALNSCLAFLVLACVQTQFSLEETSLLHLAILCLLLGSIAVSYLIIYRIIMDSKKIQQLEYEAFHDALTGLGNRAQLWNDLQEFCGAESVFSVIRCV